MRSDPMTEIECSLYELLEVPESANAEQLTAAFRRLAKEWHPDVNQDRAERATEQMKKISLAYQTLKDPAHRAAYDETLPSPEAWWAPPAGSPAATIVNDPTPPNTSPKGSQHRPWGKSRLTRRIRAASAVEGRVTRTAWLLGSAALCVAGGAFVLFLAGAHGSRDLAKWGALYALTPIFLGIDYASPNATATTCGGLLVLAGTAHVLWWRQRIYMAMTDRLWNAE
jgi:hypothetical protein